MPWLTIHSIDGWSNRYELLGKEVLIGRLPSCNIQIGYDRQDVSRRHARLRKVDDVWQIEDMRSRNHTSVNGEILTPGRPKALRHGDRIRICSYEIFFDEYNQQDSDSGSVVIDDSSNPEAKSSISLAGVGPDDRTRLWFLLEVAQSLRNVLSLDAVLADALSALLRILPSAQRGVIGFIEGDEFIPRWWKLRHTSENQAITVSRTVIDRVVGGKEAILIENAMRELPGTHSIAAMSIRSLMCAPLMDANNEVFGAILVDSEATHSFDHDDLVLLASVAVQASLAINFARLHEHALKQRAIEKDLELARDVQSEFLPKTPPTIPGYEFADYYAPARFVGGDYFDYVPLAGGKMAVVLADVEGKGAPAALYVPRMAMETRNCLGESSDPAEAMERLNRRLSSRFATFVMCVLDPQSHTISICNAGHRPPLLRRCDGSIVPLGESGENFPFGVDEDQTFQATVFELQPGESVSILSDGIEDAFNEQRDEYFGIERIESTLERTGKSAQDIVTTIVEDVGDFAGNTAQIDDMCIVAIRRT